MFFFFFFFFCLILSPNFICYGLVDGLIHYPMKAVVTEVFTSCHVLWWTTAEPVYSLDMRPYLDVES